MAKSVLNWCYGAYAPTVNAERVREQLRNAHMYKNKLIELERERRRVAEGCIRRLWPAYAKKVEVFDKADQEVEAIIDALKAERARQRRRVELTPEQAAELRQAKARRKRAADDLKADKKAAYKELKRRQEEYRRQAIDQTPIPEGAKPGTVKKLIEETYMRLLEAVELPPPEDQEPPEAQEVQAVQEPAEPARPITLDAGEAAYRRAVKEARANCGCFWGTYLLVEDACSKMREGRPPKFKPDVGSGSIGVQLQQGGLTFEAATSCQDTRLRIYLPKLTDRMARKGTDKGRQALGRVEIRIGSEGRDPIWAHFPFVYSRPIPPDAVIKWAAVDRWRVGIDYHWKLRLVLETERRDYHAPQDGSMVAVHLGYRKLEQGVRVATIVGRNQATGREVEELIIDNRMLGGFFKVDDLKSIRDQQFNTTMELFLRWKREAQAELPEWFRKETESAHAWRSPARLDRLIFQWREQRFDADQQRPAFFEPLSHWAAGKLAEIDRKRAARRARRQARGGRPLDDSRRPPIDPHTVFGALAFWRIWDRHMLSWAACQTEKLERRRENIYWSLAKRLREQFQYCVLAKIDWRELAEQEEADEKVVQTSEQRRIARIASPGRLSQMLTERFIEDAILVPPAGITATCNHCGSEQEWNRLRLMHQCTECGWTWDQDVNAARNQLAFGQQVLNGQAQRHVKERKKRMRSNRRSGQLAD